MRAMLAALVFVSGSLVCSCGEQSGTTPEASAVRTSASVPAAPSTVAEPDQHPATSESTCGAGDAGSVAVDANGSPGPVALAPLESGGEVLDMTVADGAVVYVGGIAVSNEMYEHQGFVRSVPVEGGAVRTLWSGDEEGGVVSFDGGGRIAFVAYDYPTRAGSLSAIDLTSGVVTNIATWSTTAGCASVVATPTAIFWTDQLGGTGQLLEASWDGTSSVNLAQGEMCNGRGRLVGDSIIWLSANGLESVAIPTGTPNPATAHIPPPPSLFPTAGIALAVRPGTDEIFVASGVSVFETDAALSDPVAISTGASPVVALAASKDQVFAVSAAGDLFTIHPDGSATVLVSHLSRPGALAADDDNVYWADSAGIGKVAYAKAF